jgi:hypothetical protein
MFSSHLRSITFSSVFGLKSGVMATERSIFEQLNYKEKITTV